MKKIVLFFICLCMAVSLSISVIYVSALELYDSTEAISQQFYTYSDNSGYTGKKQASHIAADEFATLNIAESGGTHLDGDGDIVFSNYIIYSISFNYDKATKLIGSTNVKVSKDSYDWCKMNEKNNYKYTDKDSPNNTEKPISYGAVCVLRGNADGSVLKYAPIFSTGETYLGEQIFNVDGDYTIYVFFETTLNGKIQNHVLSWSFKIRSYIYLIDTSTEMPIKESGLSGAAIYIDSASRENVRVEIYKDGKWFYAYDEEQLMMQKPKLEDDGTYKFIVRNGNFICEVFYFTIDTKSADKKVFFNNLKKRNGEKSYEAEGWFSFTWDETDNPVLSASYIKITDIDFDSVSSYDEYGNPNCSGYDYIKDTKIEELGTYLVRVIFKNQTVVYYITITAMDSPSYNYEKLTSARFNTFKTKWYQVYDNINGRVLCFDYDTEYNRAYNAAMTIANSSVIEASGKLFFNGKWYNDRVDLTAMMNDYVFNNNLKIVYYDPMDYEDEDSYLRTFSSTAFDNSIYLNDQFQFISQHPAEVSSVNFIAMDDTVYEVKFAVPLSEQNIPDGQYKVVETDKYGNKTEYTAYRDKSAPDIILFTEDGCMELADNLDYHVSQFEIYEFADNYDPYAVLKISYNGDTQYFYRDEYAKIAFSETGLYVLSAYDRNGNAIEARIYID